MSPTQIISEIQGLSPKDQSEVIRFVHDLESKHRLSGHQLNQLAGQLAQTKNPQEANRLREEIGRGFYGTCS